MCNSLVVYLLHSVSYVGRIEILNFLKKICFMFKLGKYILCYFEILNFIDYLQNV